MKQAAAHLLFLHWAQPFLPFLQAAATRTQPKPPLGLNPSEHSRQRPLPLAQRLQFWLVPGQSAHSATLFRYSPRSSSSRSCRWVGEQRQT